MGASPALQQKDALLTRTKALPNGANTIVTDPIELGHSPSGVFLANGEVEIQAPVLTTGELADGQTLTYNVQQSVDAAFTSPITLYSSVLVQTGAGGAGAAAVKTRFRVPTDVKRFIRVQVVKAGASNASTKSVTVELLF